MPFLFNASSTNGLLATSIFFGAFRRSATTVSVSLLPSLVHRFFSSRIVGDPFDVIKTRVYGPDDRTQELVQEIKEAAASSPSASAMSILDKSAIVPDVRLIHSAIWDLRENWRLAVLGFMWGEKLNLVDDDARNLIVWILGSHMKFNTAWIMVREWQRASLKVWWPMLVMIDRYAAANIPAKALWTFNLMEKFRLCPDEDAYHFLLSSLCKHGFIEEAEEFMLVSKNLFTLDVKWFNIILNGWCNLNTDVLEAKRIWKKMASYCITPDAISYTHMITCFSKAGDLFDSLRLYDGMKKRGWAPGLGVYNSLVYVLTRENCIEEALKMMANARSRGLKPNSDTYNAMIRALCEAGKVEEAKVVLARMEWEATPTVETYCSFIGVVGIRELEAILERIQVAGLRLCEDMFVAMLSKLLRLQKPEQALRMWEEMKKHEVAPTARHYSLVAEGLSRCGLIAVAREYVAEMKLRGFPEDPKLHKLSMVTSSENKRRSMRESYRKR